MELEESIGYLDDVQYAHGMSQDSSLAHDWGISGQTKPRNGTDLGSWKCVSEIASLRTAIVTDT